MKDALDSQDFYEICITYRQSLMGAAEFEAMKEWLRANATIGIKPINPIYEDPL